MGVCLCIPPMGYLVMGGSTRGVNTPSGGGDKSLHGVGVLRLLIILSTKRGKTSCLYIRTVRHPLNTDVATGLFQRLTTFAVIMRFASLRFGTFQTTAK